MDPLHKQITFITLHHANNHITQHMNRNKRGLNGCISSFLLSRLFLAPGLKITDAHFASVNERIQPGLESTHLIML